MNTVHLPHSNVLKINDHIEETNTMSDENINRKQSQPITPTQELELDRRSASYLENPNDVIPWSEVKAAII